MSNNNFLGNTTQNLNSVERYTSFALGVGVLWLALKRLPVIFLAMISAGLYLLYRGATGHCHIYESLEVHNLAELGEGIMRPIQQHAQTSTSDTERDVVTEAAWESFPTSDPPSWTLGRSE